AFSITEKKEKPRTVQAPAAMQMFRHALARSSAPPRKRCASASAQNSAHASKSSGTGGRRRRRAVSSVGSEADMVGANFLSVIRDSSTAHWIAPVAPQYAGPAHLGGRILRPGASLWSAAHAGRRVRDGRCTEEQASSRLLRRRRRKQTCFPVCVRRRRSPARGR